MKTYLLKIKPQSSFLTPWYADTLFGSLCWVLYWREGEESFKNFLQEYKSGNPVFVLSDGLPENFLPAPAHLSLKKIPNPTVEDYQYLKKLKKINWLSLADFNLVRQGNLEIKPNEVKSFKPFVTLHSSINRFSGTTGEEGSLFELEEYVLNSEELHSEIISIYLKIKEGWEEKIFSLFKDLSLIGFGKKKSVGKGSFEIASELEPFNEFDNFNEANGFVSLSNFIPAKDDPTKGFYKIFVKYGKLGGEFTFCGNPFKKPIIMINSGAVFYAKDDIKQFYGTIIEKVSLTKPEVLHYAYSFAVPIKI